MPQRKEVKSLVDQCMECVASKMDHSIQVQESGQKMSLNSLPSTLLEGILKTLIINKNPAKKVLFEELITLSQICFLDVSHAEDSIEMDYYLRTASIKCPSLKHLVCRMEAHMKNPIRDDPNILQTEYLTFLPKFEQLEVLILADSQNVGDECLCILGSFANKLFELNVSQCPQVTDAGIKGLCLSVDESGNEDKRRGQCKLLYNLTIHDTSVTKKGVKMALENLPVLSELQCDHSLIEILAEMHQEASEQKKKTPSFSLTLLDNIDKEKKLPYRTGSLGLAVSLCTASAITELTIQLQEGLTNDEFLALSVLTMLKDLAIENGPACGVTFDGGVIPLLEAVGSSLDVLCLEGLKGVYIGAVIEFCPNLTQLDLYENESYSHAQQWTYQNPKRRRTENTILEKLETLLIEDIIFYEGRSTYYGGVVPCEILLLLLASPLLTELTIHRCETLTDDILSQAAHLHGFTRLESLDISHCPCVTNERGIALFMIETNPLTRICLSIEGKTENSREETSSLITLEKIEEWREKAKKENWDVEIH